MSEPVATYDVGQQSAALRSWVWCQHWYDVLFLHWPVDVADIRPSIPAPLEIATYDGDAWVSLVLFRLRVRPRWLPFFPGLSDLVEVNLRTYVNYRDRPGIWFLSVHADNRWAMRLVRLFTPMPYVHAAMRYQQLGDRFEFQAQQDSAYDPLAALTFAPIGNGSCAAAGSLDERLLEHYRLFIRTGPSTLAQAEVVHPRWVTQNVDLSVRVNDFGRPIGLDLSRAPVLAHFSTGVRARFGAFRHLETLAPRCAV